MHRFNGLECPPVPNFIALECVQTMHIIWRHGLMLRPNGLILSIPRSYCCLIWKCGDKRLSEMLRLGLQWTCKWRPVMLLFLQKNSLLRKLECSSECNMTLICWTFFKYDEYILFFWKKVNVWKYYLTMSVC